MRLDKKQIKRRKMKRKDEEQLTRPMINLAAEVSWLRTFEPIRGAIYATRLG
jgi:hypothetical protein